jgi:hypothetical protein
LVGSLSKSFKTFSRSLDYYRLHRMLGSDVPFQFLLPGRPCIFGLLAECFRIYRVQS